MLVLINGLSETGKTTICDELVKRYPEKYHMLQSYTTRPARGDGDVDHKFLSKDKLVKLMFANKYIARTTINNEIYCCFFKDIVPNKINLYVIDDFGILDVKNSYTKDIETIRIRRNTFTDINRRSRFKHLLPDDCKQIDKIFYNNKDIDTIVNDIHNYLSSKYS